MIECLIRRYYLFTVDESYEDTFYDTLSFLITKINNFDPKKECKAYSYCGTVCKNYLILRRTQSIKKRDKFLSYETVFSNPEKNNRFTNELKEDDFHTRLISQTKEEIQNIGRIKKVRCSAIFGKQPLNHLIKVCSGADGELMAFISPLTVSMLDLSGNCA